MNVDVSDFKLVIHESYQYSKNDFERIINWIEMNYDVGLFVHRSLRSYVNEWSVMNWSYSLGWFRNRSMSNTFYYQTTLVSRVIYGILGPFARIFIE